jgi:phosphonate transport system substrate-binding protein
MSILFVSVMAANADPTYRAIVGYLARRTELPVAIAEGMPWPERERMLEAGQASIGAVCGATYVRLADQPTAPVQLLATPIMRAARYHDQPVYFSDIVVPADSQARAFADLRGACLAYNEPQSYSGYQIIRAHLALLGASGSFFDRIVAAGSHQAALRMVAAGAADAAAIDSTVLERELYQHPELLAQVRTIAALGPSPIPPLVAARHLPDATTGALRAALLAMHSDAEGRAILRAGRLARFVTVEDAAYDPIRAQLRRASTVDLASEYSRDV